MLAVLWPWVLRKARMGGCGIWAGRGGSRIKPEDAPAPPPALGVAYLPASGRSVLPPTPQPPTARRSQLRTAQAQPHGTRTGDAIRLSAISPQVVIEVV